MMPDSPTGNALDDALDSPPQWPDLTQARFTHRARGGYDEQEVDAYLDHLIDVIDDAERHRVGLQHELLRLRQSGSDHGAPEHGAPEHGAVAAEAVQLLSKAQVIADKCVADAEQYARDLALTARSQYREVLERAEQSAEGTRQALPVLPEAVPELDYVRTYAQVAQVQLRSVLEALTEQVDRLGHVPHSPGLAPSADLLWQGSFVADHHDEATDTPLFDAARAVDRSADDQAIDLGPTSFRLLDRA